ncbi:YihY/virulence factor BrkB family protein [Longitalea luteola]|uniref:YihY/virulence factor BrkB family protein n=1 Tax=Longitalea luteola TaxID=2812563 RepID=UPI001A9610FC|nr:YihY/virulence factor BrkB family protein [Longitalea luteola]
MKALSLKGIGSLLKDSFKGFSEDKVAKLGGSLAYFTIFSLGPMLLVIIFLAGLILGQKAVEGSLYEQINEMVGSSAAQQVQQLIKSAAASEGGIAAVIGLVTLFIGATSVFTEIQDSINTIWHLRMKPTNTWRTLLKSRLLSFGIIAGIGFLLLVSLAASALMEGLGKKISELIPAAGVWFMFLLSYAFTLFLAVFLFAIIFKVLPAAYITWREVWPGAITTAILFMLGRFLISFYISKSDLGSTYGAAGSLVVLLVWVYYSSLILYFGAEFTKAYVGRFGTGIRPKGYALLADEQTAAGKNKHDRRETKS